MGNLFGKIASETFGLSDIGKIIPKCDFDKVDGDDYVMHENNEKIFFVIKSKKDEYVFTNTSILHIDGDSALSSKRILKRYEFFNSSITDIVLETAGTIDLDIEIKFSVNDVFFSLDVDKTQIEQLKDLYKSLYEISFLQYKNKHTYNEGIKSLEIASTSLGNARVEYSLTNPLDKFTNFTFDFLKKLTEDYIISDFGYVFEKYINN